MFYMFLHVWGETMYLHLIAADGLKNLSLLMVLCSSRLISTTLTEAAVRVLVQLFVIVTLHFAFLYGLLFYGLVKPGQPR